MTSSSISLKAMTARSLSKGIDAFEEFLEAFIIVFQFPCKPACFFSVLVALETHSSKLFLKRLKAARLRPIRPNQAGCAPAVPTSTTTHLLPPII